MPVPESFARADAQAGLADAELARWWKLFGDPLLEELVNRAMAQNLDVQAAAARIREARALETVAGAAGRPQLAGAASAARQRISENAIPAPPGAGNDGANGGGFAMPGEEFSTFRVGFDASWEIDLFGKTQRSVEAARARSDEALWNRRSVQVSVAAEVASAYLALRTLQQRLATAEAELERERRFERLVAARARGGLVTGQDLEQQRSERSAAAAVLPALEAQADVQIHALGLLTGEPPEALIADLARPEAWSAAAPAIPAGLPSELLRRRPDIRAAERELAATTADIGVAIADLYPQFSLTASPALVSTALASLLEWGSRSFAVSAAGGWPLLDGGRTRGTIAGANAREEQALIAYRKAVLRALQDVEDALIRREGDSRHLAQLQDALSTETRAEAIARARHEGGLVAYSEVLLAQARRLSLEDRVIETRGALARDTVALFKALGGGWPELAGAEVQP
jgi:NodT family efflux transporter outer membrane factor (OMF) lipoprotein